MQYFNLLDIKLSHIQIFLAVAERESITKAADYLHLSQSMVSKNIKYMEDYLGLILFVREKQKVKLTPAGRLLEEEFSNVFSMTEDALEKAHAIQLGTELPISIGIPDSADFDRIFLMARDRMRENGINARLHVECIPFRDINSGLLRGEIDIAITCGFDMPSYISPEFEYSTLDAGTYYVYMLPSHPLAGKEYLDIVELRPYPFLMASPRDTPLYEQLIVQICAKAGFRPLISKYLSSPNSFVCNFEGGNEIFLADDFMRDSHNPNLVRIPLKGIESSMAFIYRKNNKNPMVSYICEQIMKYWNLSRTEVKETAQGMPQSTDK